MDLLKKKYCPSGEYCRKCRAKKEGRGLRQAFLSRGIVTERDFECPSGKPWGWEPPAWARAVRRVATGAGRLLTSPLRSKVPAEVQAERLAICEACEENQPCVPGSSARCCGQLRDVFAEDGTCACLLNSKSALAGEHCPQAKWPQWPPFEVVSEPPAASGE